MKKIFEKIAPYLIAAIYWLLYLTWRIEERGNPKILEQQIKNLSPCLFAHWHGDELVLVGYYSKKNLAVLSSLSKDGSIMAKVLELLGYQVYRGSSSKGGARGLIGLIKAVKNGSQAAIAVDGPKGPIYKVKPGIVELGVRTEKPIVFTRTFANRYWSIPRAWNKSYLPKPFAKVVVYHEGPMIADETLPMENQCKFIESQLNAIPNPFA